MVAGGRKWLHNLYGSSLYELTYPHIILFGRELLKVDHPSMAGGWWVGSNCFPLEGENS